MKRSIINCAIADARLAFERHHWRLPPNPRWDVTGFNLGDFEKYGLVLLNLADLPEYCEKLMYAHANQLTIMHCHKKKQEDIICRAGTFAIRVAARDERWMADRNGPGVRVLINGEENMIASNGIQHLNAGERITLFPGVFHEFWPVSAYAIIGEVSTANDDAHDNFFENPEVGRYEEIEEDVPLMERLLSDK